jgi:subtilisin family serine protease
VLDAEGKGVISNVIAALDWALTNKAAHNIRVINLSVGAAVTESYKTDPLTLAAKRAVDAGIVVVSAAGNMGKNPKGGPLYGSITAPGNAPWVLTVGAFSHEGTVWRGDDVIAPYSSRGPSAIDYTAKPDIVAPGTGMVSLANPSSLLYQTKPSSLLKGIVGLSYLPYLSLSGTSMAAPVVSGTVALMLQANPTLTPNMVKGILQYTAQKSAKYDALTQGGGFLNTHGAVQLARFYRQAKAGSRLHMPKSWSKEVLWGTRRIKGGALRPNANAWQADTIWGSAFDADGDNIVWGTLFDNDDNIVWGTFFGEDNIVWGTAFGGDDDENIVWGTLFGGEENIVWGTLFGDDGENIVWGTMWGADGEADNIVWGTFFEAGDNIVWGTSGEETPVYDDPMADPVVYETLPEELFSGEIVVEAPVPTEPAIVEPVTSPAELLGGI